MRKRNREKERVYARTYYNENFRKPKGTSETDFDQYSYRVVGNSWRSVVDKRQGYVTEINSPLIFDLLKGKTCLVDYEVPYGKHQHPFRTLYSFFGNRGLKLRVHVVDDTKNEKYRVLLMWTEAIRPDRSIKLAFLEEENVA